MQLMSIQRLLIQLLIFIQLAMALPTHNAFKDVGHIVKFNGENYSNYRCEFLSMMEQLGMKTMVDAPEGRVETLPTEVIIVYF